MLLEPQTIDVAHTGKPRRFVFVLMDQFTMLCFSAAVESLRIANRIADRELYAWRIIGEGGETASCSNGCIFKLDDDLAELERDDTIMLCGGLDISNATTKRQLRVFAPLASRWQRLDCLMEKRRRSTGKIRIAL